MDESAVQQMLVKIREAAQDGQNGSAAYALDRLSLIRSLADAAIHKLQVSASVVGA